MQNGSAVRRRGYGERRAGAVFFFGRARRVCALPNLPHPFLTIEGGAIWETKGKDSVEGEVKEKEEGGGKEKARAGSLPRDSAKQQTGLTDKRTSGNIA
jgi:hypothetical protein